MASSAVLLFVAGLILQTAALLEEDLLRCSHATSNAIQVSWPSVAHSKLYYVAVSDQPSTAQTFRPFAVITSTSNTTRLQQLRPNKTFWLRFRSLPSDAPSNVWGWRNYSAPVACDTTAPTPGAPLELSIRSLGVNSSLSVTKLTWEPPSPLLGVDATQSAPLKQQHFRVLQWNLKVPPQASTQACIHMPSMSELCFADITATNS